MRTGPRAQRSDLTKSSAALGKGAWARFFEPAIRGWAGTWQLRRLMRNSPAGSSVSFGDLGAQPSAHLYALRRRRQLPGDGAGGGGNTRPASPERPFVDGPGAAL